MRHAKSNLNVFNLRQLNNTKQFFSNTAKNSSRNLRVINQKENYAIHNKNSVFFKSEKEFSKNVNFTPKSTKFTNYSNTLYLTKQNSPSRTKAIEEILNEKQRKINQLQSEIISLRKLAELYGQTTKNERKFFEKHLLHSNASIKALKSKSIFNSPRRKLLTLTHNILPRENNHVKKCFSFTNFKEPSLSSLSDKGKTNLKNSQLTNKDEIDSACKDILQRTRRILLDYNNKLGGKK